jgi:molybdenum cofactor guanylyltransferase
MNEKQSKPQLTGLVLAGGASSRMGRDKAFLKLDERPMIMIIIKKLKAVCSELLIVANDRQRYSKVGVPVVTDRFPGVGVLAGLHAGLEAASHELTLAVGCDMPFLRPDLLRAFANWAEGYDVVLLRRGEHVEPLHAMYRRTCLPAMEAAIRADQRRVISFFPQVRVRYVTPDEIAPFDPTFQSFRNVNTPEDWHIAKSFWKETNTS